MPLAAAHLLSNHYNMTRDRYYRELNKASKTKSGLSFIEYSVEGLVDGIRDQIAEILEQQIRATWINYVHQVTNTFSAGKTRDRQRKLVLAMPFGEAVPKSQLPSLSPELAASYAQVGPRTLGRDLNRLKDSNLLIEAKDGWTTNDSLIKAFLPPIADTPTS